MTGAHVDLSGDCKKLLSTAGIPDVGALTSALARTTFKNGPKSKESYASVWSSSAASNVMKRDFSNVSVSRWWQDQLELGRSVRALTAPLRRDPQLPGVFSPLVYIDPGAFNQGTMGVGMAAAIIVHEMIHAISGDVDTVIQERLFGQAGVNEKDSSNIGRAIYETCIKPQQMD